MTNIECSGLVVGKEAIYVNELSLHIRCTSHDGTSRYDFLMVSRFMANGESV